MNIDNTVEYPLKFEGESHLQYVVCTVVTVLLLDNKINTIVWYHITLKNLNGTTNPHANPKFMFIFKQNNVH